MSLSLAKYTATSANLLFDPATTMTQPSFALYDASAGSGKTYTLVREYLRIILTAQRDDAYRNILAITFTNKAVHEMKSRIVNNLSEFAKDNPSGKANALLKDLSALTGMSLKAIQQKARSIIKHLIHNYAAFDISTIDKFTHRVIRAFAHDLDLPLSFEVSLDTEKLLTEAVDAIIARAGEDEILTKLLVDFTMEKTDDDKSWDVSREILNTGRLILNENNRSEIAQLQGKVISDFTQIRLKLNDQANKIEAENRSLAQTALGLINQHGINPGSFKGGYFIKHLEGICRNDFKPANKRYREPDDIALNKTAQDGALIQSVIPQLLEITNRVYRNYGKRDLYRAFLKNITPLSLLNTVGAELKNVQTEQNVLSISEFNAIIHREIQNQPAPFIYERLGERYRHFFIDEFQDTSQMQWENLIPLIDNALSGQDDFGQKGTLLIVGDPKQSIYRWRGGKAEQFIRLSGEHNPFKNPDKIAIPLGTNHRSFDQIIKFNNDFFGFLSGYFEQADYRDLYENKSRQQTTEKRGGFVGLTFLEDPDSNPDEETPDKTQQYLQATQHKIAELLTLDFEYRDIAILTRKRSQGVAIAAWLTEQNIPIISSETLLLSNSEAVRFLIDFLRYLVNPDDREAKAFLLYYLGNQHKPALPLHDFIDSGIACTAESTFEDWLKGEGFELSFSALRRKSLYETVGLLINRFILPEDNSAYVQYFLDTILERGTRNQGIADFLEHWERNKDKFSIPSPEGRDAVRILTIHKSKGLEFPVVIMPFAEEAFSRKPKDKLWLDADESEVGLPKILIDNSSSVEGFGEDAASFYQIKKQEELLDNINVLYVALTRAEEQLHIISRMNVDANGVPAKHNLSTFFIQYLQQQGLFERGQHNYAFGRSARVSKKQEKVAPAPVIKAVSQTLRTGAIKIAERGALMWGTRQQEAISYGNLVHEVLSHIKTAHDLDFAMTVAVENGLIHVLQQEEVRAAISAIVHHEALRDFFSAQGKVLSEQPIIRPTTGILKPDRISIISKKAFLLDYKTGAPLPKHRQQLENYASALEEMGYEVAKKALVYIGMETEVVLL